MSSRSTKTVQTQSQSRLLSLEFCRVSFDLLRLLLCQTTLRCFYSPAISRTLYSKPLLPAFLSWSFILFLVKVVIFESIFFCSRDFSFPQKSHRHNICTEPCSVTNFMNTLVLLLNLVLVTCKHLVVKQGKRTLRIMLPFSWFQDWGYIFYFENFFKNFFYLNELSIPLALKGSAHFKSLLSAAAWFTWQVPLLDAGTEDTLFNQCGKEVLYY